MAEEGTVVSEEAEKEAARRWPREHVGYKAPPPPDCTCDECSLYESLRLAFQEGATWEASRAPQPPADDLEALANIIDWYTGDWERNYAAADKILAAGFRRGAPAEPSAASKRDDEGLEGCPLCRRPLRPHEPVVAWFSKREDRFTEDRGAVHLACLTHHPDRSQ